MWKPRAFEVFIHSQWGKYECSVGNLTTGNGLEMRATRLQTTPYLREKPRSLPETKKINRPSLGSWRLGTDMNKKRGQKIKCIWNSRPSTVITRNYFCRRKVSTVLRPSLILCYHGKGTCTYSQLQPDMLFTDAGWTLELLHFKANSNLQ